MRSQSCTVTDLLGREGGGVSGCQIFDFVDCSLPKAVKVRVRVLGMVVYARGGEAVTQSVSVRGPRRADEADVLC